MPNDPLAWLDDELKRLEKADLRRRLAVRSGPQSPAAVVLDGRSLINFGSNDYLGLAAEGLAEGGDAERLAERARGATRREGWGSGASPLISGRSELHVQLQQALASFKGTESALLFSSGFAANLGTIAALVGKADVIFSDAKNHASIIDGCRLSGARIQIYPHKDVDALRGLLNSARGFRRRLIVSDTLFSMDGDLAPLPALASLAEEYHCMLMVDEAHATGVFGERGRGVCEQLGVEDAVHVQLGTLSKALGSSGGYVAGSQPLVEWLANRARSYVFSTAPPGAVAAAGLAALDVVREQPQRRRTLLERAQNLRQSLVSLGFKLGHSQSQIIPIHVGLPSRAVQIHRRLREAGLFVPGIRPPTVPEGESLLRISLCWPHSDEQREQLLEALRRNLDLAPPPPWAPKSANK